MHQSFDPRIFHKQLGSLSAAGFDVHLIAPHPQAERVDGVSIHPLPRPANRGERLALQPKVFRTARFLDGALYQIHDPELLPLAFLLKKKTGISVIYDMHEDYRTKGPWIGRALRGLEKWGFRWVDHVLLAEESYRSIVEQCAVNATYIANYFKPRDEYEAKGEKEERGEATGPTRLLYTGTISGTRGLHTMMELAETIQRRNRSETLDLVGICRYPDQRAEEEQRIDREGLGAIVNRVGWDTYVLPSKMSPYYRRAGVGLALFEPHPNAVRSMPTKFYEYLHYGLPIICSDFPLWRNFVDENECGVVVPPGDVEAVLDVLSEWQRCPEIYQEYARNARAAAPQYRWDEMGDRLVHVYRRVLGMGDAAVGEHPQQENHADR